MGHVSYELFFMIYDESYQNKQTNVLSFGVIFYPHSIDKKDKKFFYNCSQKIQVFYFIYKIYL